MGTALDSEYVGTDKAIHDDCVERLNRCDVVVAEVTVPSLGVGYELGRAVAMEKKILCLYRHEEGRRLSAMVRGMDNGRDRKTVDYTPDSVESLLDNFLSGSCT